MQTDNSKIEKVEGAGMKEYIERAAVIDLITRRYELPELCTHEINSIPAADVAPVRHGRWMDAESDDGCIVWHCSVCSYPVKTIGGYPIYKYCPMCGARMGKEDEHEAAKRLTEEGNLLPCPFYKK